MRVRDPAPRPLALSSSTSPSNMKEALRERAQWGGAPGPFANGVNGLCEMCRAGHLPAPFPSPPCPPRSPGPASRLDSADVTARVDPRLLDTIFSGISYIYIYPIALSALIWPTFLSMALPEAQVAPQWV
jgi:hypothetical protein